MLGLSPEVEKPGLLPARPTELGFCEAGTSATAQARRPADVYIPQWGLRGPAAFDLAVTSGLRGDVLAASAADGSRASAAYEARKRSHQHTEAQCDAQGLQFVPLVAEACYDHMAHPWIPHFSPDRGIHKHSHRATASKPQRFSPARERPCSAPTPADCCSCPAWPPRAVISPRDPSGCL